jgi:hypothetical protein
VLDVVVAGAEGRIFLALLPPKYFIIRVRGTVDK